MAEKQFHSANAVSLTVSATFCTGHEKREIGGGGGGLFEKKRENVKEQGK